MKLDSSGLSSEISKLCFSKTIKLKIYVSDLINFIHYVDFLKQVFQKLSVRFYRSAYKRLSTKFIQMCLTSPNSRVGRTNQNNRCAFVSRLIKCNVHFLSLYCLGLPVFHDICFEPFKI